MSSSEVDQVFEDTIKPLIQSWSRYEVDELIHKLVRYRQRHFASRESIGVGLADGIFRKNPLLPSPHKQRKNLINAALVHIKRGKHVPNHHYSYHHSQQVNGELSSHGPPDGYRDPVEAFDPEHTYRARVQYIKEMLESTVSLDSKAASTKGISGQVHSRRMDGSGLEGVVPTFTHSKQPIYSPIANESIVVFY